MASKPPIRTPISCTFCRQKKLRCDRLQPCSSCTKRGLGCVYAQTPSSAPRRNGSTQPRQLTQRIRQLEDLVVALQKGETPQRLENPDHLAHKSKDSPAASPETVTNSFGSLRVDHTGMTYVSGAHWTALQDSIAELKECVELGPSFPPSRSNHGSALLRGVSPPGGIAEVLGHLPPRPTVDRCPAFSDIPERSIEPIHVTRVGIMCLAIHHHQLTEGHRPDPIGDTHGLCDDFRQQAAYCLIDNKYTTLTKYTIEALMFYAQTEYFRGEEFHHEVWLLMGIVNRLAMRAGLHRDGSRYPELSCFAAEMRRRIWTLMSQLDALISFQLGLPRMIYDGLADTQPPRNLLDEDFSEDSTSLPPPRPDTAFTPVAYLIAKSRLSRVFGLVIDHAASTTPIPSALIYQLDKQLNESYAAVPVQAGGVLGQCRWFVTSLATNDFMLAAMVVCLELHYLEREGAQGGQTGTPGRDELLLALQTSHRIWAQYKDESAEAWQAWQSTSIMLRKLNASVSPSDGSNGGENTSGHSTTSMETEIEKFDPMLGVSLDHQLDGSMSVTEPKMLSPSEPEFDLSHLPSELVNLWDFTGDMSWLAM
ncbi:uncharacterized protein An08g04700 [Aspergillus niger]|uniref:Contig An08c0130, genomic contig n=2 Tax=Aspergillus niger TaxID=5061 RepID=A2QR42_ASPNC|nr:uncharacterized protein An08g04700 [Aspergillus niger]CAK45443.1 unnamed protein product [Aspergillus niger]